VYRAIQAPFLELCRTSLGFKGLCSTDHQQPILFRYFLWRTVKTVGNLAFRVINRQPPKMTNSYPC